MKIALYSDLHLECGPWEPPAAAAEADVIVLAGDIGSHTHGLEWAGQAFGGQEFAASTVLYVAGNHEYYGASLGLLEQLRRKSAGRVRFLEREAVEIDGVRFLGCTLWSGFDLHGSGEKQAGAMRSARVGINDFSIIFGRHGKHLEPRDTAALHRTAWTWLDSELSKPFDGKTVVVTHFAPHPGCVAKEHQGSDLSPYFVSDLRWLMSKHRIDVWCYGHTHTNADFIAENGCRVVSNQLGYPGERTRYEFGMLFDTGFRNKLLIEV